MPKREAPGKLTAKEQVFVSEYLICLNKTKSWERATGKKAKVHDHSPLDMYNKCKSEIEQKLAERLANNEELANMVKNELVAMSTDTSVKPQVRIRALDQLAKYLGMYIEKKEVKVNFSEEEAKEKLEQLLLTVEE